MFENSVYSVISPEGCASILWRDGKQGARAAEALRLAAPDLMALGIVDEVLPEPLGGAHRDPGRAQATFRQTLLENLDALSGVSGPELVRLRAERFRRFGVVHEARA
jgi:acetyl-CoA carboxylase carboxyl transferase subunit alpha